MENSLFPQGIDIKTRLNIVDFKASYYEYWGNRYSETECYINTAVAFKLEHSMVEKPFWIVLFKGAQVKNKDIAFVQGYWNLPNMKDAIYEQDRISINDKEDGVETIQMYC